MDILKSKRIFSVVELIRYVATLNSGLFKFTISGITTLRSKLGAGYLVTTEVIIAVCGHYDRLINVWFFYVCGLAEMSFSGPARAVTKSYTAEKW